MIINDAVYGRVEITEPVLIDLINSKPIQRLKGIMQAGISAYLLPKRDATRYDHSLGVMILLKKFGAPLEEQIAGLLHDIPHTAFSHVVDHVFANEAHDFHERFHEKILMESEIPEILTKYGYKAEDYLHEENFPLLERSMPDLCADRIDYALRDLKMLWNKTVSLDDFVVKDNEIIMRDEKAAKSFAYDFMKLVTDLYSSIDELAQYHVFANILRRGLDIGIITKDDLFLTDDEVWEKIKTSDDKEIEEQNGLLKKHPENNPQDYDFVSKTKVRYIDPKFDNTRLSETDLQFKKDLEAHKEKIKQGFFIKLK